MTFMRGFLELFFDLSMLIASDLFPHFLVRGAKSINGY